MNGMISETHTLEASVELTEAEGVILPGQIFSGTQGIPGKIATKHYLLVVPFNTGSDVVRVEYTFPTSQLAIRFQNRLWRMFKDHKIRAKFSYSPATNHPPDLYRGQTLSILDGEAAPVQIYP